MIGRHFIYTSDDTLRSHDCVVQGVLQPDMLQVTISPPIGRAPKGPFSSGLIRARSRNDRLLPEPSSMPMLAIIVVQDASKPEGLYLVSKGELEAAQDEE